MSAVSRLPRAVVLLALAVTPGFAQEGAPDARQVAPEVGEMTAAAEAEQVDDSLRFEPWQLLDEMFLRDDVVYLMRHGPTDWSVRDPKRVDPGDCGPQRVLSEAGRADMRNMGILMGSNDILPGKIVASEWCRNQQTKEALLAGMRQAAPEATADIDVATDPSLNLLLHLDGAPDVTELRRQISQWDGGDGDGPLLMISHYTNIEELTTFRVYEGEILVLDPDRDNRVLGYLRLESASPDVGHFDVEPTRDEPS